jgi:hypothetical protein
MKLATLILTLTPLLAQEPSCPGTVKHIEHYGNGFLEKLICDNAVDNGCPKELPPPAEICDFYGASEFRGKLTYSYGCFGGDKGAKFFNDLKDKGWKCKRIIYN